MIGRAERFPFSTRIALSRLIAFSLLALIGVRLWYLQGINGAYYRDLSENNRTRTVRTAPPRGSIFDREGRLIVRNRPAFDVAMVREDVPDVDSLLTELASIVGRDVSDLKAQYNGTHRGLPFEPRVLLPDVSREELAKIKVNSYRLPGLIVQVQPRRQYPFDDLAAQVFGYTREINKRQLDSWKVKGYKIGDIVGHSGLELELEDSLRGEAGYVQVEVDARGSRRGELGIVDYTPGMDVYLTLDLDLQRAAQEAMKDKRGAVVALDPNTGEVLTLLSTPSYDANLFSGAIQRTAWNSVTKDPQHPLMNRALQQVYPPGSTFKLFMALAGLASGKITPQTVLSCPGYYSFAGRRYHCHKRSGHGSVALGEAIMVSCNAYFYQLGAMLGIDTIHDFASQLGLGAPTGIDLPGEVGGTFPSSAWKLKTQGERWYPGETLSVSIGQGYVAVTPLQMAVAMATIANGGTVYRPQLLRRIVSFDGSETEHRMADVVRKLKVRPEVFQTIREMAEQVVAGDHGTGKRAQIDGIRIGGKTGTAQTRSLANGPGDATDHAWFVAFAPVENPQIAMAVIVEHGGHGGSSAAPVARAVLEEFFRKKGLVSDEARPEELIEPEVLPEDDEVLQEARSNGTLDAAERG